MKTRHEPTPDARLLGMMRGSRESSILCFAYAPFDKLSVWITGVSTSRSPAQSTSHPQSRTARSRCRTRTARTAGRFLPRHENPLDPYLQGPEEGRWPALCRVPGAHPQPGR